MLTIERNGYQFQASENGNGPLLVFVHGSASDYRTWHQQQAALGTEYYTLAYSRRYHWPNQPIAEGGEYAMMQHVEDLESILNALDSGSVHLVGHSYGALVSLLLAIKNPRLIRTLVLAEPPAFTMYVSDPPKPTEILQLFLTRPRTARALVKLWVSGLGPATVAMKQNNKEKAMKAFGQAVLGTHAYASLSEARKEQVRANLIRAEFVGSGFPRLDQEKIRSIEIPTLLISGQESPRLFYHLLDRLHELMPNSARTVIREASHLMHEDNATDYNSAVRTFLKQQ